MTNTNADSARWQRVKDLLARALELPPAEQRGFLERECGDDAGLRAEIESLLSAAHEADDRLHSLAPDWIADAVHAAGGGSWLGRRVGAWRIVALIGGGGMGEVYRAERVDGQFAQDVAVKVMRGGFNPEGLAARFKAERQILASLDHPNLAKVLDGGISEDGLPWFVMELVDGEPIDVYVAREKLSIVERVRLFRSVCQVVHYAHQKRVVHRDLKADNILVRRDGVVKLVDFGIAKRIDPAAAEPPTRTATAQRAMTLVYSSPEQVRGGEITPASDIYSLGVVLYRLLTDTSPYPPATTENPYELTRAICDTEPPPPSAAATTRSEADRRRLRGDLDAVVMMALRKDPARRYASAEAMSEDLFRHLEGLPVQARRGAWSYRAGRFLLRNRALVGAVMAANLALVAGIAVAGYEAWQANQQRARAERDFARLRQLAGVFVFDIHDAIQTLPGSTAARRLVAQTALSYLQDLSAESAGDAMLQTEVASGYRKVGDILGRPYVANLGDPKGAHDNYERARRMLQPLVAAPLASAQGRAARRELVQLLQHEGSLYDSLGDDKQAEATIAAALPMAQALADLPDAPASDRLALASNYVRLSAVQFYQGHPQDYLKSSDRSLALLQDVLARAPDDQEALQQQSVARDLRGQYLTQDDTPAGRQAAVAAFEQSVHALEHLHALAPQRADVTRRLAGSLSNVGSARAFAGDLKGSAVALQRAIALLGELVVRDPLDMDARGTRALVTANLVDLLRETGDYDEAIRDGNDALAMFDQMAAGARQDASIRSAMGLAHFVLAKSFVARAKANPKRPAFAAGDRDEACRHFDASLDILTALKGSAGIAPNNLDPETVRKEMQGCPAYEPAVAATTAAASAAR
ncbi:MAG: protein kinase domain-containing protein [Burkholderiaceae bacterium]